MNEAMSNNGMETFETDLNFIRHEYYSWMKNLVDNQEDLLEKLKDAIGDNKERIISELQTISENVLKWNRFVETIIDKYKGKEELTRQLADYSIQPQR